jgi:hypothetical protein
MLSGWRLVRQIGGSEEEEMEGDTSNWGDEIHGMAKNLSPRKKEQSLPVMATCLYPSVEMAGASDAGPG